MAVPKRGTPKTLFTSRIFEIKEVPITFSNGATLDAQYLDRYDGVMAVPIDPDGNVVFVNEYAPATDRYELGLPKGKLEADVNPREHVQIELQEEINYKAGKLNLLAELVVSPGYSTRTNYIYLARDLQVSNVQGDESEPLEIVLHPFDDFEHLIKMGRLREARMISALYLARKFMQDEQA